MAMTMFDPMLYEGMIRQDWVAAAKQNSAFLNDRGNEPFNREMFKADLKKTVEYCNTKVGRAVAAKIIDEARRFFDPEEVNNW